MSKIIMRAEQEAWNICQKLPIEKVHPHRHFGCCKGLFLNIVDDFDAPLEIFREPVEVCMGKKINGAHYH